MKKDSLIIKWLDNSLSERELEAFKNLDAFSDFDKIDKAARHFKAPHYNVDDNLEKLLQAKGQVAPVANQWKLYIGRIAAVAVVAIGLYFAFLNNPTQQVLALQGEHIEMTLPDSSVVLLNAESSINYKEKNWEDNRVLNLEGEAFFKVAKGKSFTVQTKQGAIMVLGTQFSVNARKGFFEVVCYEGVVEITFQNAKTRLEAGTSFRTFGTPPSLGTTGLDSPLWTKQKSQFKSVPFQFVAQELERQYNISVQMDESINQTLFTGTFTHGNLKTALEAITIPLNLSYDISGKNVVLKSN